MNAWLYALLTAQQQDDLPFYTTAAKSILELGSGLGRTLLPCAQNGADCTGLDNNPEFIALCQQAFEDHGQSVNLHEGDMAQFELNRRFEQIQIPLRTFQLLSPEDWLSCLQSCRRHLVPKGQLIFHISPSLHSQATQAWTAIDTRESTDGGWFLLEEALLKQARHSLLLHKATHILQNSAENQVWLMRHRLYHLDQDTVTALLHQSGFQIIQTLDFGHDVVLKAQTQ